MSKFKNQYLKPLAILILLVGLLTVTAKWLSRPAIAAWFNDNWSYRQKHTIGNTGAADSNKKVKIDLNTAALVETNTANFNTTDSTFTAAMAKRNAPGPFAAAPIVQSKDILSASQGTQINGNFYANFDTTQGSVALWYTPEYATGTDKKYIWYINANYYLAYDYANTRYEQKIGSQTQTIASTLVAGTTYGLITRWDTQNVIQGSNYADLSINDSQNFGITTQPTVSAPASTIYIGTDGTTASDGIIEGLTVYRRVLYDGTNGINAGNGDEVAKIKTTGGTDPTLATGSWDVVFALPTNSSTGSLSSTGNAWSHPHASNLLYTSTTNTGGFMMNGTYTSDGFADVNGDAQTLTLQPGATAGKDTALSSSSTTYNFGIWVFFMYGSGTHGLLYWDVSSIPASASISSAVQTVYQAVSSGGSPFTLTMYSVAAANYPWIEGTAYSAQALINEPCWNARQADGAGGIQLAWAGSAGLSTSGTDYEATALGSVAGDKSDANGTPYAISLTPTRVQGWLTGSNYGVLGISSGNTGGFASSDHSTAAYRPKLVVNYTVPPTVATLATSEKIFSGGYKVTSTVANQGISYTKALTANANYVIRALGNSDGTCNPQVLVTRADGTTEITHLNGTTTSTRTAPDTYIFTFQAPATENGIFKLINTAATGTCSWHQVEVQGNQVANPSMETGSGNPWFPTGWYDVNSTMAAGDTSQELVNFRTGLSAVLFNPQGATNRRMGYDFNSTLGKFYSLGLWGKYVSGTAMGLTDLGYSSDQAGGSPTLTFPSTSWATKYNVRRSTRTGSTRFGIGSSNGSSIFDDAFTLTLDDVSLTVTPATLANSTETSGIRVDGRDTLTQATSNLTTAAGTIKFKYTPRHSAADAVKFLEVTDVNIAEFYGGANDTIQLSWSAANTIKLLYKMNSTTANTTWTATGAIAAGTTYAMQIDYTGGSTMTLSVDGVTKITLSSIPAAFGTAPATAYWGSLQTGARQGDATFAAGTVPTGVKMQTDCDDIRFTDINGQVLDYYFDSATGPCNTLTSDFWVLMPTINAGNNIIYIYYGNPTAASGSRSSQFSEATFSPTSGPTASSEEKGGAPVSYWSFNDGTGTTAQDSMVNNNDGTVSGAAWQTEDLCMAGKCLSFDGTNDVVTVANTVRDIQSVSFWIRPITTTEQFIDLNGSAYIQSSSGTISATGFTSPTIYVDGKVANASTTLSASKWQFITVTTATAITASAVKVGQISTNYGQAFIDEVKVYNYARTAAQIKTDFAARGVSEGVSALLGGGGDSSEVGGFSQGLVGYWKMDESSWNGTAGEVLDASGNSNNGVAACTGGGCTKPTTGAGKFGNGGSFDGSNDYVDLTNSSTDLTGDLTISAWVKPGSAGGPIFTNRYIFVGNEYGYILSIVPTNMIRFASNDGLANRNGYVNSTANAVTSDVWQHIIVIKSGTNISFYVNATARGSGTIPGTATIGYSGGISYRHIGYAPDGSWACNHGSGWSANCNYSGSLDDVRIYNRALSPKEVRDLYNWAPGPAGYWNFDEKTGQTANDISGNGLTGTLGASSAVASDDPSWTTGKFGSALNFDGSNDYVSRGAGPSIVNTVEFWTYPTSTTNYFVDLNGSAYISVSAGTISATGFTSPTIYVNGVVSSTLTANTWQHVAVTTATNLNASALNFGKISTNYLSGKLDDVRIYNYARTQKQIVSDMNAGHPAVGSPVGSAVGYWKFDEGYGATANNSGSGSSLNGTITGATWTNSGKFAKGLTFAGSTNSATVGSIANVQTVSFWVNPSTNSQSLLALTASAYISASSGTITATGFTSPTIYVNGKVSSTLTASVWQHVLVATNTGITASALTIGRANSVSLTGTIDEVKIYNFALTSDEVKTEYNRGSAIVLGAAQSASQEYCIPGDGSTCTAPVAEWKFDEGSGASVNDSSGNANTGTWVGGSTIRYTPGKIGKAGKFNGSDDCVNAGNSASLNITSAITVEAWIKYANKTGWQVPVGKGYDTTFAFKGNGTQQWDVFFETAGRQFVPFGTLSNGVWYYLVGTFDGRYQRAYRNSELVGTNDLTNDTIVSSLATALFIGATRLSYQGFNGLIDQVRIYNYARTAAQVAWDYNRGGPIGWWKMDECSGSVANDASGNGNNGTITIGATGSQTGVGNCTDGLSTSAWYNGASGKLNSSLNFDGTDDVITVANIVAGVQSVSFWAYPTSTTASMTQLTSSAYISASSGTISATGFTSPTYYVNGKATTSPTLVASQWNHIVVTTGTGISANAIKFGLVGSTYFAGQLDDARVYNYALTATQIKTLYNDGAVRFAPLTGSP